MSQRTPIDALSLAVADGAVDEGAFHFADGSDEASVAACLRELSALKAVFDSRAAGPGAEEPVCPFRWGRLEVLEVIGQGSFARVYRAHDRVLDRDVALKLFRRDRSDLDADQLIAEARRHARVHHPRVLAVHGADVEDNVAGMWTDLLEGRTLADHVRELGRVAAEQLRVIAGDLAAGLGAAHQQGIIHGDLKPANVWLDGDGHAILMDFGAAEARGGSDPARYGSPVSMAPELFEGGAPSVASDCYALGCVLHFAATGRYPRTGTTAIDIRDAHRAGSAPDLRELRDRAPSEAPLIAALLAADPARRPGPEAVQDALEALASAPQRRFRRRAIGAIIASLVIGLGASLYLLQRSEQARAAAETARANAEQARFEATTSKDFLIESVRRMSPESERGLGTVRAVLDFLDEFSAERLADTPLALGELKVIVGTRLTHFDEVDRGLQMARAGIELIEREAPDARMELVRAYNALADAQRRLSRYEAARESVVTALDHLSELEQTEEVRYKSVQLRGMLVGLLGDLGEWGEGLAAQRQQLAERAALVGADDPRMAVEYNNLGHNLLTVGLLDEALEAFRRALSLLQAGEEKRPFPEALVSEAIASTLMTMHRHEEARAQLEETRERFVALGVEAGDERFKLLHRLEAGTLRREGRLAEALAIYDALLEDATMQPYTVRATREFRAVVLLGLNRPAEALSDLQRAREAYAWREGHPERRYLDAALAYARAAASGQPEEASPILSKTQAWFDARGYGRSQYARQLRDWLEASSS